MITAFGNHGLGQEVISLFDNIQGQNIKPSVVNFLGVLSACNHGGFVEEGRRYFKQMTEQFNLEPTEKHYACMVDLFGRAGCLQEVYKLINSSPMRPT